MTTPHSSELPVKRTPWRAFGIVLAVLAGLLGLAMLPMLLAERSQSQARRLLAERDYQGAIQVLSAALKYQPRHGSLHYLLGRAYRHLEDTDACGEHLALAREYGFAEDVVQREFQLVAAQAGQMASIEPYVGSLLANEMDELPEICEALARGFILQLRFKDANRMLDAWNQVAVQEPLLHVMRGDLLSFGGEWRPAGESYRTALRFRPQHEAALLGLAEALIGQEAWLEAESTLRKAEPVAQDSGRVTRGLARCLLELGRLDEAARQLGEVPADTPPNDPRRMLLARLALRQQQPAAALEWLTPLIELWPEDVELATLQVEALRALGREEEAERRQRVVDAGRQELTQLMATRERIDAQDKNADVRYEIGATLVRRQSRRAGMAWLLAATLMNPMHRDAHEKLVATAEKTGDLAAASRYRARMESIVEAVHRH